MAMPPDERALRGHIAGPRFIDGVERGKWRVVGDIEWPYVLVAVTAATRVNAPREYFLRVDAAGYPSSAPTLTPWDPETRDVLAADSRPKGERAGAIFRSDWADGEALYAPFDRVALGGHSGWRQKHPRHTWHAGRDLAWVLQYLHDLLNDADYTGV